MPRRAAADNVMRLTKAELAKLAVPIGMDERTVWDSDLRGFGVRLRASGAHAWVIRPPRSGGRSAIHTLGPVSAIALADARRSAQERLAGATLGEDPNKARREARAEAALTFGSVIDRYVAEKEAKGRRASTITNLRNHLNNHWEPFHRRGLNSITQQDVAARHREIAEKYGAHAADRARSCLSTFFAWTMTGDVGGRQNPVANTRTVTTPNRRERVLSDAELARVWKACRDDDFGRIVRLLILTAARRNEVAGICRSEIDKLGAVWVLPKARSKNHREHEVPLSRPSRDILASIPLREGRDLLFGDGKCAFSGFSAAKARLDKRTGEMTPWSIHDLRRTAATGMAEIGVLPHVVEAALNHVSGHRAGVAGVYNRASYRAEKRAALDLWAKHVASIVTKKAEG